MKKLLALLAPLALLSCTQQPAYAAGDCPDGWPLGYVVADAPKHDAKATTYSGATATRLLTEINAAPPETHFAADQILVLDNSGAMVLIGLVEHGCVMRFIRAGRDTWTATRDKVTGAPS